jgi:hypothetical protein
MTLTKWGHYVDVMWELVYTFPGYDERELCRNYIRGLPREEFADAVKRLHNELREWDREKMEDATTEQHHSPCTPHFGCNFPSVVPPSGQKQHFFRVAEPGIEPVSAYMPACHRFSLLVQLAATAALAHRFCA